MLGIEREIIHGLFQGEIINEPGYLYYYPDINNYVPLNELTFDQKFYAIVAPIPDEDQLDRLTADINRSQIKINAQYPSETHIQLMSPKSIALVALNSGVFLEQSLMPTGFANSDLLYYLRMLKEWKDPTGFSLIASKGKVEYLEKVS